MTDKEALKKLEEEYPDERAIWEPSVKETPASEVLAWLEEFF